MFKKLIDVFFSQEQDFYQNSVDNYFKRDLKKDKEVFDRLRPNDDFGRSITQHICQVYPFRKKAIFLNCVGAILFPVVLLWLLFRHRVYIKDDKTSIVCYKGFNFPGCLPYSIKQEDIRYLTGRDCPYYIKLSDLWFIARFCIRSIRYPFLVFRLLMKVSRYRPIIDSFHNIEAIAITGEFESTSSALTQYCHENGIKHYNFMQGDMFGSPRIAFFHFDKCFVWDQYYVDMFVSFGACPEQFEVSLPQCLKKNERCHSEKTIDYIYYIGGYPDEDLHIIRTAIDKLVAKGYVCEIRPHPRWSDLELVEKIFQGITIQDTNQVTINDSILMSKKAIGLSSTVLLQAYFNEVNVVIDDISSPEKYKMLEGYQYIMLNKPHQLLSEITK